MRPEVRTSLDSDLALNRLSRFRYLNTCSLTLVRGSGSDRLDRFLCPTSNPGRSRCLLVSPSNCIKRVWWAKRDHACTRMRGRQAHAHEHARMRSMRHSCADMRETLNYYVVKFVCKFVCSVGGQSYSNTDPSGIH